MTPRKLTASLLALAIAAPAIAATDGSLGATSTGTADVSVNLVTAPTPEIQISGLSDIVVEDIEVGSTTAITTPGGSACVYSPDPLSYSLELSVPDMVGDTSGAALPYTLGIGPRESSVFLGATDISSGGTTQTISSLTSSQSSSCADNTFLSINATIDPTVSGFPTTPDAFSTTITFTVTPE